MLYYPLNSLLYKILRLRVVVGFSIFLLLYVIVGFILNLRLSKYYPNFYEKEKGKVRRHSQILECKQFVNLFIGVLLTRL